MSGTLTASLSNTIIYVVLALACCAAYRFYYPQKVLLWIAACLVLADDNILYHWLLERGTLTAELLAAIMGMCSALCAVKSAMLLFKSERLVPLCAFLTLPLSMTAVMLFHDPELYPYQLAISQMALGIPYVEAAQAAWRSKRNNRLSKAAAGIFAGLALVYPLRMVYAISAIGSQMTESQFLNSAFMQTTLLVNSVLVIGVLVTIFVILGGDFMEAKRAEPAGAPAAKTPNRRILDTPA